MLMVGESRLKTLVHWSQGGFQVPVWLDIPRSGLTCIDEFLRALVLEQVPAVVEPSVQLLTALYQ